MYCADTVLDCANEHVQNITNMSLQRILEAQPQQRPDNRKSKKRAPSNKRMSPSKDGVPVGMDKEAS